MMRRNTKVQVMVELVAGKIRKRFAGRIVKALPDGKFQAITERGIDIFAAGAISLASEKDVPSLRKLKQRASTSNSDIWKKPKYRILKPCNDLPLEIFSSNIWKIKNYGVSHRGNGHNVYRAWEFNGMVLTSYNAIHKATNVRGSSWEINVCYIEGIELVKGTVRDVMADIALLSLYDD